MLEADPEKRPTIWQVSDVVCLMQGRPNRMPNVFVSQSTLPVCTYVHTGNVD